MKTTSVHTHLHIHTHPHALVRACAGTHSFLLTHPCNLFTLTHVHTCSGLTALAPMPGSAEKAVWLSRKLLPRREAKTKLIPKWTKGVSDGVLRQQGLENGRLSCFLYTAPAKHIPDRDGALSGRDPAQRLKLRTVK